MHVIPLHVHSKHADEEVHIVGFMLSVCACVCVCVCVCVCACVRVCVVPDSLFQNDGLETRLA